MTFVCGRVLSKLFSAPVADARSANSAGKKNMTENEFRFTDGAAYERFMGPWTRAVARFFWIGYQFLRAGGGSMWAVALACSPSCSSTR